MINDKENIVPFVVALREIVSLYLLNNPCVRLISGLRKQLVLASSSLYFLDDRPITDLERRCAVALEEGGKEAETAVRKQAEIEHRNKLRMGYERNKQIEDESRVERKKQFKRMMADVSAEKEELTDRLKDINHRLKSMDSDSEGYRKLWQIKFDVEREVR